MKERDFLAKYPTCVSPAATVGFPRHVGDDPMLGCNNQKKGARTAGYSGTIWWKNYALRYADSKAVGKRAEERQA